MPLSKSRSAHLLIGEFSQRTGVNVETIRYYERIGLLPKPPRTSGRHRVYDHSHVQRLRFVRRGRELGFTLEDIRTLLALAERSKEACAETKEMTLRHLADVRGKIASLKKLDRALAEMTSACRPGRQRSCPILDTLGADA
ncbi:MAG: MerR family transcriptional regulator [Methyloceanibacter sp.]|uniref:MerR family transcriptional regulator n=1 Tax=Methyloceanibacter sp. TaxID=1965321 RepID=UPI003D6CACDF